MKMAVESIEMAPGAIPHPGRVPEQSFTFDSAWERFNLLLSRYPGHTFSVSVLCKNFYQGLTFDGKMGLETANQYRFLQIGRAHV